MDNRRKTDHLVYGVSDLDAGCDYFEELLGVRPVFGGHHHTQGTKNALLNLGDGCYLELLAIDKSNTKIKAPRWMGIDHLTSPKLTRWAIKSADLESDSRILKTANSQMGTIIEGARKAADGSDLSWKMILPLASPEVELLPFVLDWGDELNHPTKFLEEHCKLISIEGTHSAPNAIKEVLSGLGTDLKLRQDQHTSLKATIESPNGVVEI